MAHFEAMDGPRPPVSLDRLAVGADGVVIRIGPDHEASLAREGIERGSRIFVEASAPLGGPLVVKLGRARLALARSVARTIEVGPHERPMDPLGTGGSTE